MDDLDPFTLHARMPTALRPLIGLTILVVDDSRFASEALRLMCLRSGARIRRADSLRAARRHLQVYRPSAAIIDIGLRDGSGADLIAELDSTRPRIAAVIGMSGNPDGQAAALAAGADGFLEKPVRSIAAFQELILRFMPADRRPAGPRAVSDEKVDPDMMAYRDDLALMADVLQNRADDATVDYVAQFLSGVARSVADETMLCAAEKLAETRASGLPFSSQVDHLAGLVRKRLDTRLAI